MAEREVPDGAAVFPLIPAELGIQPLLLAVLHAIVFLDGSDNSVVQPEAATEALEYIAGYVQRLSGKDVQRAREDFQVLLTFARQEKWKKGEVEFIKRFLSDFGVEKNGGTPCPS
jgi:hypothetical protein